MKRRSRTKRGRESRFSLLVSSWKDLCAHWFAFDSVYVFTVKKSINAFLFNFFRSRRIKSKPYIRMFWKLVHRCSGESRKQWRWFRLFWLSGLCFIREENTQSCLGLLLILSPGLWCFSLVLLVQKVGFFLLKTSGLPMWILAHTV